MELKVTKFELREDGIATVWLHRPGRGNSWTNRMNAEYRWIMSTLDANPEVRAVVVTGTGNQFCVGADTKALDFYTETDEVYKETVKNAEYALPGYGVNPQFDNDLVWHWGLRVPVIAAINGACAGIAVAIANFCDLRYAASGAKFTTATPRLGLPAEYGLAWTLPRMVGVTNAAEILFTGKIFTSEEMFRIGFLNGVFPAGDEFLDKVYEVAKYIATKVSPTAATVTKRQLYSDLLRQEVGTSIEDSKGYIGALMRKPDFTEGVAAMAEKRQPRFGPREELPPLEQILEDEKAQLSKVDPASSKWENNRWSRETTEELVNGRKLRVYAKRPRTVAEFLVDARRWSDRTHVIQGDVRLTFADHEKAVARVANWMGKFGIKEGSRVAMLARNRLECSIAFWASHCLGAVVVLGNPWWSEAEVHRALELSNPEMVLCDKETVKLLPNGMIGILVEDLTDLLEGTDAPPLPQPMVDEDAPALVAFTSGTTGSAKGVILSQRSIVNNIQNMLVAQNRLPSEMDPSRSQRVTLLTLPLFHGAGIQVLTASLLTGAKLVYQAGRFNVTEVMSLIEKEKITTWGAVPTMVIRLMNHQDFTNYDLTSLTSIQVGGSAADADFRRQVNEAFPSLKSGGTGSLYGLQEGGGLLAMASSKELKDRHGCVGKLLPVVDVKILDPDEEGNGEILVQTPGMMSGYLGNEESPIDEDGLLHSGDVGHVSEDGYLYLSGRKKEIIIRGGENISSAQVEQVLMSYAPVAEVSVVGLPHKEMGEEVGAVIVLRWDAKATIDELLEHAKDNLGRFQLPTKWWIRRTPLPTNAMGKVVRKEIQKLWLEQGGENIVELEEVGSNRN
ncbi:AMP-binding protein [Cytobacillus depressus]|uniref:AMP-binding protein n=1 Tax=Cytobacillus depressus TaxID=1602942 RepID=A0A6L3V090_9BACI|nr:AMP-binding protein [Cytobacillus depressus]KAB2330460.1 AMP-binding protein [Cytobacillus depressus]